MLYTVYILECADKTLYVGYTINLALRLKQHNDGRGGQYTAARLPVRLIYSETCHTAAAARTRELQIKSWTGAKRRRLPPGTTTC
jgi:putative endonuclease